ncbi:hypothetical protein JMJ35_005083 [Cladonia borealis]|uniref:Uncharacterized protein n=1 Tax=Cladonia borealis TaxID=184061 RepID=A0AA39R1B3_9LECA|nr:hypothetical protein JMJ35_005083 [Cladonia borealis]
MILLRFPPLRSIPTPNLLSSISRAFSTHPPLHIPTRNRIYDPVRSPSDFDTLLLLTTSSRTPLLTLWTASYSPPCRTISPLLHHLLSSERPDDWGGGGEVFDYECADADGV